MSGPELRSLQGERAAVRLPVAGDRLDAVCGVAFHRARIYGRTGTGPRPCLGGRYSEAGLARTLLAYHPGLRGGSPPLR